MSSPQSSAALQQQLTAARAQHDLAAIADAALQLSEAGALDLLELFAVAPQLEQGGRREQAIGLYRAWLQHTASPLAYAAQFNLAVLLLQGDDEAGALQAYQAALALRPDFPEAFLNLGSLHERMRQPALALSTWERGLHMLGAPQPGSLHYHTRFLNNLGRLCELQKRDPEAESWLARSMALNPEQPNTITHWVHLRQKQCAWPAYADFPGLTLQDMLDATSALAMLSASDDPAQQLAASRRYVERKVLQGVPPLAPPDGYVHPRLRVGYLSQDLCAHAVAILTAELYELHDRSQVEVYAFSWSREDGSPMRRRLVQAMDHYVPIAGLSDQQAAEVIRSHEIDILVDLHGLTLGARHDILAYRPAPVQLTWLGFPGPTGLPSIDYVIADRFVLPPELEPYFTERPLHLPECFQINDRQRAIGARPTRAASGLADDAMVYCCFNSNHKLNPAMFDSWMRILQAVPHGVLWLVAEGPQVRDNLLREAQARGIGAERLVFADRVPPADYLARFQVADLFLDTLPFNAGTTASDALWAGLPVLTQAGRGFAGRMAGSLLRAVGLPELVTHSAADYEALAIALGNERGRLQALRQRLAEQRLSQPLFDTPRFVRHLEQAYRSVAKGRLQAAAAAAPPAPLVSVLVLAGDAPCALERALESVLAQSHTQLEIIVADHSADGRHRLRAAGYETRHPRLRYLATPGASLAAGARQALAQAQGAYVNFMDADTVFARAKLERMVELYERLPRTGLVTSARFALAIGGARTALPSPFTEDASLRGQALAELMLTQQRNLVGGLGAPLLRRADAESALGRFDGRDYAALVDVATWLSIFTERDCIYLSEALSSEAEPAPSSAPEMAGGIEHDLEWLQLALDAHARQRYLAAPAAIDQLLAERLPAFAARVAEQRSLLRLAPQLLEPIQQALRQGYQLLLR